MSEIIFSSRVFKVVKRFITGRSGNQLERHIVIHPGAVVILPELGDGRVVLIRQHRVAVDGELIELPAGTMESNEEPIVTARRELIEETGYTAESLTHVMRFFSSPGFIKEEMHLFHASGLIPGPTAMEDGEKIETIIVTLADAMKMIAEGEIHDAKTIIGLYWLHNKNHKPDSEISNGHH
ncbi:MAG: NUDIX hydrolase [Planctomycetaceae bacterium]|jgi:ADP-ribose pyrophosphatase|nr:NUDIX hydrolase [Planctomycetaceae bacterium]